MADLTLRSVKGTPLTNNEVDGNFTALNDAKVELTDFSVVIEDIPADGGNLSYDNTSGVLTYSKSEVADVVISAYVPMMNNNETIFDFVVPHYGLVGYANYENMFLRMPQGLAGSVFRLEHAPIVGDATVDVIVDGIRRATIKFTADGLGNSTSVYGENISTEVILAANTPSPEYDVGYIQSIRFVANRTSADGDFSGLSVSLFLKKVIA